jgi:hypothetical protein
MESCDRRRCSIQIHGEIGRGFALDGTCHLTVR